MDPESLEKWKENFQKERKKQISKVKELQKETFQRRKTMEMKAQIEAAREEKRRQEALAERKAQHIEATMRFQKGIKNFKINKEKISLDDVLKQISTPRNRVNSADDRDRIKSYNTDVINLYQANNKPNKNIRRSSSFDSINHKISFMNKNEPNKTTTSVYRINNNFNMIEQYNTPHYFQQQHQHYNQNTNQVFLDENNLNKIQKAQNIMNQTIESKLNNPLIRPNSSNFKEVINESQKTIQEINKEALKEFQSLIKNEITQINNTTSNNNNNNSNHYSTHQKFNSIIPMNQKDMKKDYESYSDYGTIITIDDMISDGEDDRESMDTDSLLNVRIESTVQTVKTTANKKDGENDSEIESLNHNPGIFDLVSRNLNLKKNNDDQSNINLYNEPFKGISQNNQLKNTESSLSENKNLKKNLDFSNNTNQISSDNHQKLATNNLNRPNLNSNSISNIKNNKQIKSILKRSSSLDNNSLTIVGLTNQNVNFGIKTDKNAIKDSIELTNNRLNSHRTLSITSDNSRKKSVRFANMFSDDVKIVNELDFNESKTINDIRPNQVQVPTESDSETSNQTRISSTNSIRRPIIKPRNTSFIKPKISPEILVNKQNEQNNEQNNEQTNKPTHNMLDEKPPVYPQAMISPHNAYSTINQKRKEFYQRNKLYPNDKQLNSPKTTAVPTTAKVEMSPNSNFHQYIKNNLETRPNDMDKQKSNFANTNQQQSATHLQYNNTNSENSHQMIQQHTNYKHFISKTPNSTLVTTNNNEMQYQNLKYNENYYREFQFSKLNNEVNNNLDNSNKLRLNNTEPGFLNLNENLIGQNPQFKTIDQLTRIPISPKSTLQQPKTYFNPNEKQLININGVEQISLRRPFSATGQMQTINTRQNEQISDVHNNYNYNNFNLTKTNTRVGYVNNQQVQLINNQLPPTPSTPIQRVLSADDINNRVNNKNQTVQLEVKYPLYSNYQTQFINIAKPMRSVVQTDGNGNAKEVLDSMALFLKAEEMSNKNYTESQILNTVQDVKAKSQTKKNATALSLEEQNLKNSIIRLNERLNMLAKQQNRFNKQDDVNIKKNSQTFIEIKDLNMV